VYRVKRIWKKEYGRKNMEERIWKKEYGRKNEKKGKNIVK
jgi:hypothetical protein